MLDFDSDSSSTSSSDSTDSEMDLELFEERQHPKNENFIDQTVAQFNDSEFREHFRLGRELANNIALRYETSEFFAEQSGGNGKIGSRNQLLIFLWFAGHEAASFRDVADRFHITISSLYRIIRRLTYFLSSMSAEIIIWPNNREKQETETFFRQNKAFPGIIGVIDGSHVRIDKPSNDPDAYYNRKKYFSIQLQAVCDHKMKIRDIFVGYPGAVHDARVFRTSSLSDSLIDKCSENYILLGDSAYPCSRHLITPFKDTGHLNARQRRFNQKLSSCRYIIEHCFGLLKQKFRQLYHCKLRKIKDIVHFTRACCVLHNMAIDDDFQFDEHQEIDNEIHEQEPQFIIENDEVLERDAPEGVAFRNYLMERLNI